MRGLRRQLPAYQKKGERLIIQEQGEVSNLDGGVLATADNAISNVYPKQILNYASDTFN